MVWVNSFHAAKPTMATTNDTSVGYSGEYSATGRVYRKRRDTRLSSMRKVPVQLQTIDVADKTSMMWRDEIARGHQNEE